MQDAVRLWPPPPVDRLGRRQPQRLQAGAFLDAVPGLADQFAREVPATHLIPGRPRTGRPQQVLAFITQALADPGVFCATHVHCTCGSMTRLERPWSACSGDCGRWFAPHGLGARVAGPYAQEGRDAA